MSAAQHQSTVRTSWPISSRLLALLKLAMPRCWAVIAPPLVFGYVSTGDFRTDYLILGTIVFTVMAGIASLFGHWMDQEEDRITHPFRQVWIDGIGHSTYKLVLLFGYLFLVVAPLFVNRAFVAVTWLGIVFSILYPWGPRLKARPIIARLSFSAQVPIPFLAGWLISRPLSQADPILIPLMVNVFAFGQALMDIADIAGDRATGVRTMYTLLPYRAAISVALFLLLSAYLVLAVLQIMGIIPAKYWPVYLLMPAAPLLMIKAMKDKSRDDGEVTFSLGMFYQFAFATTFFLIYYPHSYTFATAIVSGLVLFLADFFQIDDRQYTSRRNTFLAKPIMSARSRS